MFSSHWYVPREVSDRRKGTWDWRLLLAREANLSVTHIVSGHSRQLCLFCFLSYELFLKANKPRLWPCDFKQANFIEYQHILLLKLGLINLLTNLWEGVNEIVSMTYSMNLINISYNLFPAGQV